MFWFCYEYRACNILPSVWIFSFSTPSTVIYHASSSTPIAQLPVRDFCCTRHLPAGLRSCGPSPDLRNSYSCHYFREYFVIRSLTVSSPALRSHCRLHARKAFEGYFSTVAITRHFNKMLSTLSKGTCGSRPQAKIGYGLAPPAFSVGMRGQDFHLTSPCRQEA